MSGWYSHAVPIPQKAITPGDRSGCTASGLGRWNAIRPGVIDVLLDLEEYSTGPPLTSYRGIHRSYRSSLRFLTPRPALP
jgi:hypothetical protein